MKFNRYFLATILMSLLSFALIAQKQKPPLEQLEELIRCDTSNQPNQYYLLDFWATWCAPCIGQFPHINKLKEETAHLPLEFIAVTRQKKDKIVQFLSDKELELNTCLGFDYNASLYKQFSIKAIPYAILVYPDGKTLEIANLESLKAEHLEKMIRGEKVEILTDTEKKSGETDAALTHLEITAMDSSTQQGIVTKTTDSAIKINGESSLKSIISSCFAIEGSRILMDEELGQKQYRIDLHLPGHSVGDAKDLIRQFIAYHFQFKISRELVDEETLLLKVGDSATAVQLDTCSGDGFKASLAPGAMQGSCVALHILASQIEQFLDQPVINEVHAGGKYSYTITFKETTLESVAKALEEQAGLKLEKEMRKIEYHRVLFAR